jgi:hypothetical protein
MGLLSLFCEEEEEEELLSLFCEEEEEGYMYREINIFRSHVAQALKRGYIYGVLGFVDIILLLCWKVWSRNLDGSFVSFL